MTTGQKHLIKCRCVLPHLKSKSNSTPHHFIVFSVINDDETVQQKYAQCNNCGVIHKIIDICRSEIMTGKEHMNSLMKVEDIKASMNPNFCNILEINNADLPTWEAVQFIIENKKWGEFVIMSTDNEGDEVYGKYIRILGESLCKIETFTRSTGAV
jgi:hypothetical protein